MAHYPYIRLEEQVIYAHTMACHDCAERVQVLSKLTLPQNWHTCLYLHLSKCSLVGLHQQARASVAVASLLCGCPRLACLARRALKKRVVWRRWGGGKRDVHASTFNGCECDTCECQV
eukprot:3878934-Pleurochrysis_carterae.AAC.1